jgi:uncharacterized repeat protein (TIGR01451 family)
MAPVKVGGDKIISKGILLALTTKELTMKKLIYPLTLSIIMAMILASCSLFGSGGDTQTQVALATPALPAQAAIELTVQADTSVPFNTVGQVIKYTYNVKNTGTIPTSGPVVIPGATCPEVNTVGNLDVVFDINEVVTCTSSYTITQADLDKGSVSIITTATANGVSSNPVTTTVATTQTSVLKLEKTANPTSFSQANQTITFTYVITNTGAAPLGPAQFIVTDTGISAPINCGDANTTLAPNATLTCSAAYTVTQANVDAGSVATSATVSGGGVASSQAASVTVAKTSTTQTNQNLTAGSTIQHQVANGEWLWQIARCYGADPTKVLQANPQISNPAQISPNTTINVPNIGSAGKIYGKPCVGTHTVQSGDTWASIAQKYNADATVLQKVNANTLTVGKVLVVPLNSAGTLTTTSTSTTVTATPTTTAVTACPIPAGWVRITVQANETLSTIATRYGTTQEMLMQQNCLTSSTVAVGAVIYVPSSPAYPNQ